jgi:hypothetical protein
MSSNAQVYILYIISSSSIIFISKIFGQCGHVCPTTVVVPQDLAILQHADIAVSESICSTAACAASVRVCSIAASSLCCPCNCLFTEVYAVPGQVFTEDVCPTAAVEHKPPCHPQCLCFGSGLYYYASCKMSLCVSMKIRVMIFSLFWRCGR